MGESTPLLPGRQSPKSRTMGTEDPRAWPGPGADPRAAGLPAPPVGYSGPLKRPCHVLPRQRVRARSHQLLADLAQHSRGATKFRKTLYLFFLIFLYLSLFIYIYILGQFRGLCFLQRPRARRMRGCARCAVSQAPQKEKKAPKIKQIRKKRRKANFPECRTGIVRDWEETARVQKGFLSVFSICLIF